MSSDRALATVAHQQRLGRLYKSRHSSTDQRSLPLKITQLLVQDEYDRFFVRHIFSQLLSWEQHVRRVSLQGEPSHLVWDTHTPFIGCSGVHRISRPPSAIAQSIECRNAREIYLAGQHDVNREEP